VKVVLVIEAALIAMLKVALMVALMATFVAPGAGVTETTPGMLTVSTPHPATKATNKVAKKCMYPILNLRICIPHVQPWRRRIICTYLRVWPNVQSRHELTVPNYLGGNIQVCIGLLTFLKNHTERDSADLSELNIYG
jgi:hypothetical protein